MKEKYREQYRKFGLNVVYYRKGLSSYRLIPKIKQLLWFDIEYLAHFEYQVQ